MCVLQLLGYTPRKNTNTQLRATQVSILAVLANCGAASACITYAQAGGSVPDTYTSEAIPDTRVSAFLAPIHIRRCTHSVHSIATHSTTSPPRNKPGPTSPHSSSSCVNIRQFPLVINVRNLCRRGMFTSASTVGALMYPALLQPHHPDSKDGTVQMDASRRLRSAGRIDVLRKAFSNCFAQLTQPNMQPQPNKTVLPSNCVHLVIAGPHLPDGRR